MTVSTNWWSTFFSGTAVNVLSHMTSDTQTDAESNFILKQLALAPGATVADLPCGNGRLTVAIANRGYRALGVDISPELVAAARARVDAQKLSASIEVGDMRQLSWQRELDGAFCFGNSFPYFDDAGNREFLAAVSRSLKIGARFVCETGLAAESIFPALKGRTWYPLGETLMLHSTSYDPCTSRLESEYIFVAPTGIDRRAASYPIYRASELVQSFQTAGFKDVRTFGSLEESPYALGTPRLFILGTAS